MNESSWPLLPVAWSARTKSCRCWAPAGWVRSIESATRLGRTVAIKVLSAHAASDADHRQRFEREARAISTLNHPHICTLHDIGHQDGIDFLLMEYVEGDELIVEDS